MAIPTARPTVPSTATASPTLTPGSVRVDLPADWQGIEVTEAGFTAAIKAANAANPTLAKMLQQVFDAKTYTQYLDYAVYLPGGKVAGAMTIVRMAESGMSVSTINRDLEKQLTALGATDLTIHAGTVHGRAAQIAQYLLKVTGASGESGTFAGRTYFVGTNAGALYALSITCFGANAKQCLAEGDDIGYSLLIGE